MIEDNTKLSKYILLDTNKKSCYAYIGYGYLTQKEANIKNKAFTMNRANKQYVLEKNWK